MPASEFAAELGTTALDIVRPLRDGLRSPDSFGALLISQGWAPPDTTGYVAALESIFGLGQDLTDLEALVKKLTTTSQPQISDVAATIDKAGKIIGKIRSLVGLASQPPSLPSPLNQPAFWQSFPPDLVAFMLSGYLKVAHPMLYAPLFLLGVIDEKEVKAGSTSPPGRLDYIQTKVVWNQLHKIISNPGELARTLYGWGATFDYAELLRRLEQVAVAFGVPATRRHASPHLVPDYYPQTRPAPAGLRELRAPLLIHHDITDGYFETGLLVLPIPRDSGTDGTPVGVLVGPYAHGGLSQEFALGGPFVFRLHGAFASDAAAGIEVRPQGLKPRLSATSTTVDFGAEVAAEPRTPALLAGSEFSGRVQWRKAAIGIGLSGSATDPELKLNFVAEDLQVVVQFSEGDGFLQKVFGTEPQTLDLGAGLVWSSKAGLSFAGKGVLTLLIPVNKSIGPVEILLVAISIKAATGTGIAVGIGVTGSVALGPLKASVDNIGLKLSLLPKSGGTLDGLDVDFAFKPPDGAGLVIDSGVVVGGGYLYFDPTNEQYAGVLELEAKGIALKAIGLLTTRMPDGSKGFSLLIIITAEFPPIQLGFGFSLTGVGGLLGLNRTMAVDPLRDGIKNRTLNAVLFPQDPVKNAPQIISDLRAIFPPAPGRFVIGPVAQLGWGTPVILTIELGIAVSLPAPVTLVLLGRLRMVLPTEEAALIKINMDVLGVIEFDKSEASLDAVLYDSYVAGFTLTGAMAMRMSWGPRPAFALAAGGFNKRFTPPPKFPALERLAISLAAGDNPRLRLEAYLALTSNTVQIGARLDLFAGHEFPWPVGLISLEGYLFFDTLFQFSPFQLAVDIGAGIALKRNGEILFAVDIELHLTGPGPWHAWGTARFQFIFKLSIGFDVTLGADEPRPLPPVSSPVDDLVAELNDLRNWSAQLPGDGHMLVSVRQFAPKSGQVVVHPFGDLTVRQRKVPLNITITAYGNTTPQGLTRFEFGDIAVGQSVVPAQQRKYVKDLFAPANFFSLDETEKLSRPSFEAMDAGATITTAGITHSGALETDFGYEDVVVDVDDDGVRTFNHLPGLFHFTPEIVGALALWGPAAFCGLRTTGAARYGGAGVSIALDDRAWVVAGIADLKIPTGIGITATDRLSYTEADEKRRTYEAVHPQAVGTLQVVELQEVPA